MSVLATSARSIPEPSITKGLPKPVLDALAEREHVRGLLSSARNDHEEVVALHRRAVESDRNAQADVRFRQTGEKFEPAAPALEARLKELADELDVLNLAAQKAEDALSEAIVASTEKIHAVGRAALIKALKDEKAKIESAIAGLADAHAAIELIRYAADVEVGIVPRGIRAHLSTGVKQMNGDDMPVEKALRTSLDAVERALASWEG